MGIEIPWLQNILDVILDLNLKNKSGLVPIDLLGLNDWENSQVLISFWFNLSRDGKLEF